MNDGVELHVAHRDQAINLGDAQPMQNIGHELLKAHVLDARHALGAVEVSRGAIAAFLALACVVNQELGDFAQCPAFFAVVHNGAGAAFLSSPNRFFDSVHQVGTASADVRTKDVRAIALVVYANGELFGGIRNRGNIAKQVDRSASNGRQENFQIRPSDQLGVHSARLLKQSPTKRSFVSSETSGNGRQVPNRLDGGFSHHYVQARKNDFAVHFQTPF